jgi:streptogramin lyase
MIRGLSPANSKAMQGAVTVTLVLWLVGFVPTRAWAMNTGDIIVADRGALIFVDHLTGAQHLLSGTGGYIDVTTNSAGDVFALGTFPDPTVYKIDTITGARTVVATGGNLTNPFTIDLAPDGNLYIAQRSLPSGLFRIDPLSGVQTSVVSGTIRAFTPGDAGVGYIVLADDPNPYYVYQVDLTSGQIIRLSNTGIPDPRGLARDGAGNLIIAEYGSPGPPAISRLDPQSGTLVTVSGQFMHPWGVTLEMNGTIVTTDNQNEFSCTPVSGPETCPGALFRIDPVSGAQTLVTEKDLFHDITGVDVYRGPNVPTPTRRSSWGQVKSHYR